MSQSRPPRAQSRAPGAQSRGPIIRVPEEKPEATEPVSKDPMSQHSLTEEEPVSKDPLTAEEEGKLRDEDRVGPGPRFRQTPVRASRGRHIV